MSAITTGVDARIRKRSVPGGIASFALREFGDAVSSRWFILYTVAFSVLAMAVSFLSLTGVGSHGFAGFGRTTAGLLNLIMLIVPLMALTAGAGSIAGERERGTLLYLLAQPVSRTQVLLGKFIGLSCALSCSLCVGFGSSAIVLAWRAGGVGVEAYAILVGFTCALAIAMLAIGFLISALSRRSGVATGVALFVWLTMVFLSDLGLMAGSILFKLRVQELFALGVANPLQAFKMGVIVSMNGSLDVLGPGGRLRLAHARRRARLPARRRHRRLDDPTAGRRRGLLLAEEVGVRRASSLIAIAGLAGLNACGGNDSDSPPTVRLGDSICSHCGMIISDERFATATIAEAARGDEALLFDDFNCQVDYEAEHPDLGIVARWSHDYRTAAWLHTEHATFLNSASLRTPMASQAAAFESRADAESAAEELGGDVLTFDALWSHLGGE